jgi:PAS domain S-box-containing protein
LRALLKLVSAHYEAVDEEHRGIVKSMRLMADEARVLAHEAHQQSSEHLQVILDHIKDGVPTLDEDGSIRTFNPTAARVFGYDAAEVIGRRTDLLVPQIAQNESIAEALQRLAANSADTLTDLAARESWGVRKDGKIFLAENAISHAPLSRREMFVVCVREAARSRAGDRRRARGIRDADAHCTTRCRPRRSDVLSNRAARAPPPHSA